MIFILDAYADVIYGNYISQIIFLKILRIFIYLFILQAGLCLSLNITLYTVLTCLSLDKKSMELILQH